MAEKGKPSSRFVWNPGDVEVVETPGEPAATSGVLPATTEVPEEPRGTPMTSPFKPPALDPQAVPARTGSGYPEPYRALVAGRERRALGDAAGLKKFGVNLTRLPPGAASSQRHWHTTEDEFVYVLEGELTLVTDAGEQRLGPGMAAGFPAGTPDGHHLVNKSAADALYLEVGDRPAADEVTYSDIDLHLRWSGGPDKFTRKDGTPY